MAKVVLPGALRQFSDGAASVEVALGDGATLADVLDGLAAQKPALARRLRDDQGQLRRFVNVYVDGEDARQAGGLAAPVPAGAEVLVLPSVAGG
ncbi:MAG: thiamine S protein [Pseudonocardiales bacterium]|nr:thiamine S protein [Pseudonocardiales bacterium]